MLIWQYRPIIRQATIAPRSRHQDGMKNCRRNKGCRLKALRIEGLWFDGSQKGRSRGSLMPAISTKIELHSQNQRPIKWRGDADDRCCKRQADDLRGRLGCKRIVYRLAGWDCFPAKDIAAI